MPKKPNTTDKLLKQLEKVLSWLPFDGSKIKIGAFIALLGAAGIDPIALAKQVAANPSPIGIAIIALGVAHKLLKAKYG